MIHFITTAWDTYVLHFEHGNGYQFWSGISGSFIVGGGIWVGVITQIKKHTCHQKRCYRFGHPHPDHGWPSCRKHYKKELILSD